MTTSTEYLSQCCYQSGCYLEKNEASRWTVPRVWALPRWEPPIQRWEQKAQQKRWLKVPQARDARLRPWADSWEAGLCVKLFNCLNQQCQDVESMGEEWITRLWEKPPKYNNDISNPFVARYGLSDIGITLAMLQWFRLVACITVCHGILSLMDRFTSLRTPHS